MHGTDYALLDQLDRLTGGVAVLRPQGTPAKQSLWPPQVLSPRLSDRHRHHRFIISCNMHTSIGCDVHTSLDWAHLAIYIHLSAMLQLVSCDIRTSRDGPILGYISIFHKGRSWSFWYSDQKSLNWSIHPSKRATAVPLSLALLP